MMQLSTAMWTLAIFFGVMGFLRGWNRELVATAGILLAVFALFQFDSLLRSTVFLAFSRDQIFFVQAGILILLTFMVYRIDEFSDLDDDPEDDRLSDSVLGALVGAINGYLLGGSLWYFLDINEYPLQQFVTAPSPTSVSAQVIDQLPLVVIGGGTSGTGDLLAVLVIGLLFFVLVVL